MAITQEWLDSASWNQPGYEPRKTAAQLASEGAAALAANASWNQPGYEPKSYEQGVQDWMQHQATANDKSWLNMNDFGTPWPTYNTSGSGGGSYGGGSGSSGTVKGDAKWPEAEQLQGAQQYFEQIPEQYSYYKPIGDEEVRRLAAEYGQLYAAPQYAEIERKLQQAISDAQAQEERIRAGFAGTEDALARREKEQSRLDLESAIARGAGRSGVVPWLSSQRQQHFSELLAAAEAKKNAELYGIANQLGLVQRQVPEQRQEIAEQLARIQSQELQRLQDLDYARAREYDTDQWERMLNMFDRTMLTPVEQLQLYLQMAQVAGKFPESAPSIYGTFGTAPAETPPEEEKKTTTKKSGFSGSSNNFKQQMSDWEKRFDDYWDSRF